MTIANLTLLPDWNSLDSVRAAHSNLEAAALVFFALLVLFDVAAHFAEEHKNVARWLEKIGLLCFAIAVICEIFAYRYGQRNDALSEQKIRSLDTLAHDAENTAGSAKTIAGDAKTKSGAASSKADEADAKSKAAEANAGLAQERVKEVSEDANHIKELVTQLRTKVEETDLILTATASGHKFLPIMFNSLKGEKRANVEVACIGSADSETLLFTQSLAAAFTRFGWSAPIPKECSRDEIPQVGVKIFNKRVTIASETFELKPGPGLVEDDPSFLEFKLENGNGLNKADASRLAILTLSLGATLEQNPALDDNTFRIVVGKGKLALGK